MQSFIQFGFVLVFAVGFLGCDASKPNLNFSGLTSNPAMLSSSEKSEQPRKNVVYSDSLSDLTNMQSVYVNGVYQVMDAESTRVVLAFMELPELEPFSLKMLEDSVTKGADGKPGVLALSWDKLPSKAAYSGFTYHGRKSSGGGSLTGHRQKHLSRYILCLMLGRNAPRDESGDPNKMPPIEASNCLPVGLRKSGQLLVRQSREWIGHRNDCRFNIRYDVEHIFPPLVFSMSVSCRQQKTA